MDITQLEQDFICFHQNANNYLSSIDKAELQLFFTGSLYTGRLESCDVLFLSINPGYSLEHWSARSVNTPAQSSGGDVCYKQQLIEREGDPMAKKILSVVFAGDESRFDTSVASYVVSPFATPNIEFFQETMSALTVELRAEHERLMVALIDLMLVKAQPRVVIVIGVAAFDKVYTELSLKDRVKVGERFDWIKFEPDNRRMFAKARMNERQSLLGCIHLTGSQVATHKLDRLEELFSEVIS